MRYGQFADDYRGNGWHISFRRPRLTLALRWRWHFYTIRPEGKPHCRRFYFGPFELQVG